MRLHETNPRNLLVIQTLFWREKKKKCKSQRKKKKKGGFICLVSLLTAPLLPFSQRLPLLDAGREQKLLYPTLTNRAFWHQDPSPGLAAVNFSLGKDVTCQFLPVK